MGTILNVLSQASDGNFYGTTGGSGTGPYPYGTIFRYAPAGSVILLHVFNGNDGQFRRSGVIQASDGNFYGSTVSGTGPGQSPGTIFRFGPTGLTTLYNFVNNPQQPYGMQGGLRLLQADDGRLYGATSAGGIYGSGTIFRISLSGDFLKLYNFRSSPGDSANPSPLIQGNDGNLYGTNQDREGGANQRGTIFWLDRAGQVRFSPYFDSTMGQHPTGLIQASDSLLYGYMQLPTPFNWAVFRNGLNQPPQVLYQFQQWPVSDLLQANDGALFGVTREGGANNTGYVFRLQLGLPAPPAVIKHFSPQTASSGQLVTIVGRNFVGTRNVQINGTTAPFKVMSPNVVYTVVPTGATSGKITLTNLAGSTLSSTDFTVQ